MASERISIPIDRQGRLVLPKEIRERLGLDKGGEVEIEEQENVILLKPVASRATIVNKGGWLVVQSNGPPITPEIVEEVIEKTRRENRWR